MKCRHHSNGWYFHPCYFTSHSVEMFWRLLSPFVQFRCPGVILPTDQQHCIIHRAVSTISVGIPSLQWAEKLLDCSAFLFFSFCPMSSGLYLYLCVRSICACIPIPKWFPYLPAYANHFMHVDFKFFTCFLSKHGILNSYVHEGQLFPELSKTFLKIREVTPFILLVNGYIILFMFSG